MNLKALFTTILVVCSITLLNAQSKDILAKSAMLNADEAYANGQYFECIGFLKDAETNLGATNSRIQYLKVKSLMAWGRKDQFKKTIWLQADTALKVFFEVTPENGYVPEKYDEMLLALSNVKTKIAEIEASEQLFKQLKFGSVTDSRDGKTYKTINIGTQTWLAENLAYKTETGCWAYDNNPGNVETYGYLYNWETAINICPSGWHLPNKAEWEKLINNMGGETVAGAKLKEEGATHWKLMTYGATNESGFTALPGGLYSEWDGTFNSIEVAGNWWSTTGTSALRAWSCSISSYQNEIMKGENNKESGKSVRCVKDK